MTDRTLICCLVLLITLAIVFNGLCLKESASNWTVIVKPESIGWVEQ
jgi:hypothetical protein